jgi:hypothetical protein
LHINAPFVIALKIPFSVASQLKQCQVVVDVHYVEMLQRMCIMNIAFLQQASLNYGDSSMVARVHGYKTPLR